MKGIIYKIIENNYSWRKNLLDNKGFKNAVDTLKLYHRIKDSDLNINNIEKNDDMIEKLYVDLLPNQAIYEQMRTNETTFLVGRRGTGKSTIISRVQHSIRKEKINLSVYINAKSVHELSKVSNITTDLKALEGSLSKEEIRKLLLLRNFLSSFESSLLEELKNEKYGFFEKINNVFVNKKLQGCLKDLKNIISKPELININNAMKQQENSTSTKEAVHEIKLALELEKSNLSYGGNNKKGFQHEIQTSNVLARYFDMNKIIDSLKKITEICAREKIFIFIDDFSELEKEDMISFVNVIMSPLYHLSKDFVNLKIACYPNRVYYGDLDIGKYRIVSIDMYDIFGKQNISLLEKSATNFTERIIKNRIDYFCTSKIEDYFDVRSTSMNDYYKLLFYSSMNITRILGHILYYCWLSHLSLDKKINRQAIEEATEQYYRDYTQNYFDKSRNSKGIFDDKVDIFVQENLIEALISEAQLNKTKLKETDNSYFKDLDIVPTSHFMVNKNLENLLSSLEFNGFIHKVNELASKGSSSLNKNPTNTIYSFDYGLTVFEKIKYGKPQNKDAKFYQQRSFNYTNLITTTLINNKKIVCQNCKKEYAIEELEILQRFKMKCDNCQDGVCKIEYDRNLKKEVEDNIKDSLWTEDEIEIIYCIHVLSKNSTEEKISAALIGQEIDRSYQFVSRRCKELAESGYVVRQKNSSVFEYGLSEETEKILERLNFN